MKNPGSLSPTEIGNLVTRVLEGYEVRYIKIPPEGGCLRVEYRDGEGWKEKVIRSLKDLEKITPLQNTENSTQEPGSES